MKESANKQKQSQRAALQKQIAEFERNGGRVQRVHQAKSEIYQVIRKTLKEQDYHATTQNLLRDEKQEIMEAETDTKKARDSWPEMFREE